MAHRPLHRGEAPTSSCPSPPLPSPAPSWGGPGRSPATPVRRAGHHPSWLPCLAPGGLALGLARLQPTWGALGSWAAATCPPGALVGTEISGQRAARGHSPLPPIRKQRRVPRETRTDRHTRTPTDMLGLIRNHNHRRRHTRPAHRQTPWRAPKPADGRKQSHPAQPTQRHTLRHPEAERHGHTQK